MHRVLQSIDRWGPALVSVMTLFFLAVFGWSMSVKVSKIEGQLADKEQTELALRTEIQTLQAYVVSLKEAMIRAEIETPPTPKQTKKEK